MTKLSARTRPKTKITDEIVGLLRQDIIAGRLARGERMPSERLLAESFGVSQPTVRESLRALEIMGLVEVHHGSGTFVSGQGEFGLASALLTLLQIEAVGVLDLQDVRRILGLESASLAASVATSEQVQAIERALYPIDHLDEVTERSDLFDILLNHQTAMAQATNNPLLSSLETFLATLMLTLQAEVASTRTVEFWRSRMGSLQPHRRAMYEAIRDRAPDRARAAAVLYYEEINVVFRNDALLKAARFSDPSLMQCIDGYLRRIKDASTSRGSTNPTGEP